MQYAVHMFVQIYIHTYSNLFQTQIIVSVTKVSRVCLCGICFCEKSVYIHVSMLIKQESCGAIIVYLCTHTHMHTCTNTQHKLMHTYLYPCTQIVCVETGSWSANCGAFPLTPVLIQVGVVKEGACACANARATEEGRGGKWRRRGWERTEREREREMEGAKETCIYMYLYVGAYRLRARENEKKDILVCVYM